jgi:hypothetical protein
MALMLWEVLKLRVEVLKLGVFVVMPAHTLKADIDLALLLVRSEHSQA